MQGQINWAELFFSSTGRLSRTPFVIAAAALIGSAALYELTVPSIPHWLTGWIVYPVLVYSGACLLSKRLHDRGRSGWLAAVVLLALIAVWPVPHDYRVLFLLVVVWAVVELGLLSGEQGANRFGPNPGRTVQA
ncbi:uncharacterized membrane protein YhaH (DUF805 family) [Caulobacter ginsengisoli]|uniref:Uncharacterized membrane protein YhaH (DUF805 family) n=1 Tax=Caulobacter ginsengisoli TaxID=400775 RepID=A0ABU0ILF6_9CAUL|nr:DUF805 domain-containing protein [Caulobacter ginsengisoli]MDQ0462799.1 uncharacterized membrane protein YhaH (DUF805 family) [Caulobacter ginsengisoli]